MLNARSGKLQCDHCGIWLVELRSGMERKAAETNHGWVWINMRDYCAVCAAKVFGSEYRRNSGE